MTNTHKADLTLLFVTVLAATGWIFTKLVLAEMPPIGYIAIRYLGAALILIPFAYKCLFKLNRQQWIVCITIGIVQAVMMYLWTSAVNSSNRIGEGAFIMSLSMIAVPFLAKLFYSKKIDRIILIALPFALAGVALLALKEHWQFEPAQGLFLVATFLAALHFVYTNQKAVGIPSMAISFNLLFLPGVMGAIASGATEQWPNNISYETLGWLLAAIILSTSLRYFIYTWALTRTEAARASLIMILEPVWTAIASVLWLGEVMTPQQQIGCVLIFSALIISRTGSFKKILSKNPKASLQS